MAAAQEQGEFITAAVRLLREVRVASLATLNGDAPHVALVTPALAPDGSILLLLSSLSAHTRHLQANPAFSLLLAGFAVSENPQTAPRLTLTGHAAITTDPDAADIFLNIHPYAALYAGFADFAYWRLTIAQAHYVGGFAAAATLDLAALQHEISVGGRTPQG